jgi:hypothetical protein
MGTTTMEESLSRAPKLSFLTTGLLDQPPTPILGING